MVASTIHLFQKTLSMNLTVKPIYATRPKGNMGMSTYLILTWLQVKFCVVLSLDGYKSTNRHSDVAQCDHKHQNVPSNKCITYVHVGLTGTTSHPHMFFVLGKHFSTKPAALNSQY